METWKDIDGFPGYQVSDQGRVRTFWKKKHYPTGYGTFRYLSNEPLIMSQSDDGNGYMKLMLYSKSNNKRVCKKVHRLVAEAFIDHDSHNDTVDHIRSGAEGKLDNSVSNLRWISRTENIKKAYRDGVCDDRIRQQKKSIVAIDLWTNEEYYFESIQDAAEALQIERSNISHVLIGDCERTSHYVFEYAGREDMLLHGGEDYNQQFPWL